MGSALIYLSAYAILAIAGIMLLPLIMMMLMLYGMAALFFALF